LLTVRSRHANVFPGRLVVSPAAARQSDSPAQPRRTGRAFNLSRQCNKRKGKSGGGGSGAGTHKGYFVCQGFVAGGQAGDGAQPAPSSAQSKPAAPPSQATVAAAAPSAQPAQACASTHTPCCRVLTALPWQPELDTGVFRVAAMKRGRPLITIFRVGAEQIVVFVDTGADISLVRCDVVCELARRGAAPPTPPVTVSGVFGAQRQPSTYATIVLGPERKPCSLLQTLCSIHVRHSELPPGVHAHITHLVFHGTSMHRQVSVKFAGNSVRPAPAAVAAALSQGP